MKTTTTLIITCFCILISSSLVAQDFYKRSTGKDSLFVKENNSLINELPTKDNSEDYFKMANILWNIERNKEAKKMLLYVVQSDEKSYNTTYQHSSDIPGDTSTNVYGYGSFTSNYKNKACLLLTKIYIEEKDFKEALKYLEYADEKYIVEYTCGTGHHQYQNELIDLYGLCFEGLNRIDEAIELLISTCFTWNNSTIIRLLKKKYGEDNLKEMVVNSIDSIEFTLNEELSEVRVTRNSGTEEEENEILKYRSGVGVMKLFGRNIRLPEPSFKNNEIATKQHFIDEFKASSFYTRTTGDYSGSRIKISYE